MPSLIGGALGLIPFGVIVFLWAMTPRKNISRREWFEAIGMVGLLMLGTICFLSIDPVDHRSEWREFVQAYLWTGGILSVLFLGSEFMSEGFLYKILAAHVREQEAKAEATQKESKDKIDP